MRLFHFLILYFLITASSFGQTQLSLVELDSLNNAAWENVIKGDYADGLKHVNEIIASRTNHKSELSKAYLSKAAIQLYEYGNYEDARFYLKRVRRFSNTTFAERRARIEGELSFAEENYERALKHYDESFNIAQNSWKRYKAKSNELFELPSLPKQKVLDTDSLSKKWEITKIMASINIAHTYTYFNPFNDTISTIKDADFKPYNDTIIYLFQRALRDLDSLNAYKLYVGQDNDLLRAKAYAELYWGEYLNTTEQTKLAILHLKKASDFVTEKALGRREVYLIGQELGMTYRKINDLDRARKYFDISARNASQARYKRIKRQFDNIKEKSQLQATAFTIISLLSIILFLVVFYRYRQQRDETLKKLEAQQKAQLEKEYIAQQQLLQQIQEQNTILEKNTQELKHKKEQAEFYRAEMNHRVKNNLQIVGSTLKMQLREPTVKESPVAQRVIMEALPRIYASLLIHQLLQEKNKDNGIELQEYLEKLMGHIQKALNYSPNNFTARIQVYDNIPPMKGAVVARLGMIIVELAINAFKYSPDSRKFLDIEANVVNNNLCVRVVDKGQEQEKQAQSNRNVFGLEAIQLVIEQQFGGKFPPWEPNEDGIGRQYYLEIPVENIT